MKIKPPKEWSAFIKIVHYDAEGKIEKAMLVENERKEIRNCLGECQFEKDGRKKIKPYGFSLPGGGLKIYDKEDLERFGLSPSYCEKPLTTVLRELFQETNQVIGNDKSLSDERWRSLDWLSYLIRRKREAIQREDQKSLKGWQNAVENALDQYVLEFIDYTEAIEKQKLVKEIRVGSDEDKDHLIYTFEVDPKYLFNLERLSVENDLAGNTVRILWADREVLESCAEAYRNGETPEERLHAYNMGERTKLPIYKAALARLGFNPWQDREFDYYYEEETATAEK